MEYLHGNAILTTMQQKTKYGNVTTPVRELIILNEDDIATFDFIADLRLEGMIDILNKHSSNPEYHQFYVVNYGQANFVATIFVRPPETWLAENCILMAVIAPNIKTLIYHFEAKYRTAPLSDDKNILNSVIQMLYAKQEQLNRRKGG